MPIYYTSIRNKNYGDGSDGDTTISVSTNLAKNMYYNSLIVTGASVFLNTQNYIIYSKDFIRIEASATIRDNASTSKNASGSTAGTTIGARWFTQSGGGANGVTNANGSGGTGGNPMFGGSGANGGNAGANIGGGGGATSISAAQGSYEARAISQILSGLAGTSKFGGGGGGGSGASDNVSATSGGGGAGGGVIVLCSPKIYIAGNIDCFGGTGGNASGSAGNAGGGGGGGGGYVALICDQLIETGTINISGGAGGTGYGTGATGATGSAGKIIRLFG